MSDPDRSNSDPEEEGEESSGSTTLRPDQTIRLDDDSVQRFRDALRRKGTLLVIAGTPADIGNHLVVERPVVIGREQGDLPLRDGRISRQHATVERQDEGYFVTDLGSTNGTRVNGHPLRGAQQLEDGDQILVGQTIIKFTLVDHTEARYLKQMERLVGTDELTGLVAKHRFDAALKEAIRSARSAKRPLSVLMMDMDGLKTINDSHGHHAGAATIRHVGELIARVLRSRGEACRFGGDEFSVYLPGVPLAGALAIAEEIRHAVEVADFGTGSAGAIRASISIGAAELPPLLERAEALLELADQALYRAKKRGRNTVSD